MPGFRVRQTKAKSCRGSLVAPIFWFKLQQHEMRLVSRKLCHGAVRACREETYLLGALDELADPVHVAHDVLPEEMRVETQ